ncbi:hypothetical protein MTYP_01281 [Methylophilaceae bacterium]|nr:hypothetical protein MTYP_01281 [Methylophilaceae bacterium]
MQLRVLGCSGGIGGSLRTTSFLIDSDILLDAGTGVGDLSIEQLLGIDHIFITHSHLDHIACIPLLADTVLGLRDKPVNVHATVETWQIISEHIFNWKVWPDFTVIPNPDQPILAWKEIRLGQTVMLGNRRITPVPANHVVPAVGFHLEGERSSLIFSGDTTICDALWAYANCTGNLQYLLIETAFSNDEAEMAKLSKHLCPALLLDELAKLEHSPQVFITHLKPGEGDIIMQEIVSGAPAGMRIQALDHGHIFEL